MEMELKNIIEKIKTEGVEEAQKQQEEIVSKAEDKAKKIIQDAEDKKKEILEKAKADSAKLQHQAEESIRQASRDVLLGLRDSIISLFDKVVKKKISDELNPQILKELLTKLVENFSDQEKTDIEILLSDADKKELEKTFLKELQKEINKGVELKASPNVEHGFRIGEKDSNSYYDFTDQAIEEAFKSYLNKKLISIMTPGAKGGE